jgi:hypothetical protein
LLAMHGKGFTVDDMIRELQQQGLHSRKTLPVTRKRVLLLLWRLGLRPGRAKSRDGERGENSLEPTVRTAARLQTSVVPSRNE